MIESKEVSCPYCGVTFTTNIDCSAGNQIYTEDCHICCQPIEFKTEVGDDFDLLSFEVRKENE
jgi:transcription elongation factor Elf1